MALNHADIEATILALLAERHGIAPEMVTPATLLFQPDGLGLSSMQALNFVLALEDRFGMELPETELTGQVYRHTLGSLAAVVRKYLGEA